MITSFSIPNNSLPESSQDVSNLLEELKTQPESYWIQRGEKMALNLFHQMAGQIPAYQDFLKKLNINPVEINSFKDFKRIPSISKDNFLKAYPRQMLCPQGEFSSKSWVISTTSGSTGEPFYFPRQTEQDLQYALTAELYLITNFQIDKKKTLYIVGFPMGAWIGGLFTYQAIKLVAERGKYPLSIITPGINKLEIIKAVKNLGKDFDQVLIGSYAPFLKDIIDDGIAMGLNWREYNLGFIFSAEGFSENFRDYVAEKTGLKNVMLDTLNHYGTVDLGTMSYETPVAILIRRLAVENAELYQEIFGQTLKLPTLTQFFPEMFYFEEDSGNLYCSARSGLPLVRYDLKDHGGVLSFEQVCQKLSKHGFNLEEEAKKAGIFETIWKLPFVYVYERSDFSVSFFAFQIYPETIRKALQEKTLEKLITGKFTMLVKYDQNSDQVLEVNIELKSDVQESEQLKSQLTNLIKNRLLAENSEYRKTTEEFPEKTVPQVVFWPYEDPTYFKPGTKQKWIKKND